MDFFSAFMLFLLTSYFLRGMSLYAHHCKYISNWMDYCEAYLIFVIFFTQARFLENKIYTEERVNYDKWILRQNSVNRDLLGQANYKDQDYTKFVTHCV